MKRLSIFILSIFCVLPVCLAERRVAFIIGNGEYTGDTFGALTTPVNDAMAIAETLSILGFEEPVVIKNGSRTEILDKFEKFAVENKNADVVVFYYSGHGYKNANDIHFIVPVDVTSNSISLSSRCIDIPFFMETLEENFPLSILFLDACRDRIENTVIGGYKSIYTPEEDTIINTDDRPLGQVIYWGSQSGKRSFTGSEILSPFTEELVKHLADKREFTSVWKTIVNEVSRKTNKLQIPMQEYSYTNSFYFNPDVSIQRTDISNAVQNTELQDDMPVTSNMNSLYDIHNSWTKSYIVKECDYNGSDFNVFELKSKGAGEDANPTFMAVSTNDLATYGYSAKAGDEFISLDDGILFLYNNGCLGQSPYVTYVNIYTKQRKQFSYGARFVNGYAPVQDTNGKYGYLDKSFKLVIPAIYDRVTHFSQDGYAYTHRNNKDCIINTKGVDVYTSSEAFCKSTSPSTQLLVTDTEAPLDNGFYVSHANSQSYVTRLKTARPFRKVSNFPEYSSNVAEGMICCRESIESVTGDITIDLKLSDYYYADCEYVNGNPIDSPTPSTHYSKGLLNVRSKITGLTGYIDTKGMVVIPFRFSEAGAFNEDGIAKTNLGYINTQGELFSTAYNVSNNIYQNEDNSGNIYDWKAVYKFNRIYIMDGETIINKFSFKNNAEQMHEYMGDLLYKKFLTGRGLKISGIALTASAPVLFISTAALSGGDFLFATSIISLVSGVSLWITGAVMQKKAVKSIVFKNTNHYSYTFYPSIQHINNYSQITKADMAVGATFAIQF